jgi:hypothetical protein
MAAGLWWTVPTLHTAGLPTADREPAHGCGGGGHGQDHQRGESGGTRHPRLEIGGIVLITFDRELALADEVREDFDDALFASIIPRTSQSERPKATTRA